MSYITTDKMYAAVPWGDRFVVIHNGQQLDDLPTLELAKDYIQQHKKLNSGPKAPRKGRATQKSQKIKESPSVQQGSQTQKSKPAKTTTRKPKSKTVTPKKSTTRVAKKK